MFHCAQCSSPFRNSFSFFSGLVCALLPLLTLNVNMELVVLFLHSLVLFMMDIFSFHLYMIFVSLILYSHLNWPYTFPSLLCSIVFSTIVTFITIFPYIFVSASLAVVFITIPKFQSAEQIEWQLVILRRLSLPNPFCSGFFSLHFFYFLLLLTDAVSFCFFHSFILVSLLHPVEHISINCFSFYHAIPPLSHTFFFLLFCFSFSHSFSLIQLHLHLSFSIAPPFARKYNSLV